VPTLQPDVAILHTLLYADIFDYPLTPAEIHHFLIDAATSREAVDHALENSTWLRARVAIHGGYVTLPGRQALATLRDERRRSSERLWAAARRWGAVLGCLPFVRMVAVTGALAVDNAPPGDDIDFLIVTAPGRVWLARGLAVMAVRAARMFGAGLCPNYVLAETALEQQRRDLFIAHDLAQMVPLVGCRVYGQMRAANAWASQYLPQATAPLRDEPEQALPGWGRSLQRWGEALLGGGLGDGLERWEQTRKLRKFAPAAGQAGSAAELDANHVKGHFDDNGHPILRKFRERVAEIRDIPEAAPAISRPAMSTWIAVEGRLAEEAAD
jgi:hypothetical protein